MNPYYVSGLVEGEGCFAVSFSMRQKLKLKIETRPSFSLSLNRRDLELLKSLREYFKCGAIRFSANDNTYKFEVRAVKDLVKKIIPHFEKFPLRGKKKEDFDKFKEICIYVYQNKHRSVFWLKRIIELAYAMNKSGKRRYKKEALLRILAR